jgi:glc operon protein GlcG
MKNNPTLTIEDAKQIAVAAEAEAQAHGWRVSIAIVDSGGHLVLLHRLDGAPLHTMEVAALKGRTSALTRGPSKSLEDKINGGRVTLLSLPGMLAVEGGEAVIVGKDCVGAVGVSGAQSHEDAQVARAGIGALKLADSGREPSR